MSGSLTLMTNLCLAWTTSKIQSVMQTSSFGNDTTWLKAVSPAHFRNINLKGTFAFPVDQYRERLVWRRCDRGASVKHQWSAEQRLLVVRSVLIRLSPTPTTGSMLSICITLEQAWLSTCLSGMICRSLARCRKIPTHYI